jgi:RNA recognition motif-containing protein
MNAINIYVGNLAFGASEEELKELFEAYGRVDSAKIVMDHATGRSRGFGFIEMPEREEAMKAIQELDSQEFKGRSLRVNEARPKRERTEGGDGGGRRDGGDGGGGMRGRPRW